jgi:hypothetical protein
VLNEGWWLQILFDGSLRKSTGLLLVLLSLYFFTSVQAASDQFWIYGTIMTTPKVSTYNNFTYSEFNFSVSISSASWLGAPVNLTVVIPTNLLVGIALIVNQTLNMTGVVEVVGVPSGYFVCEEFEATTVGWLETFKGLISLIGAIGKAVVTLVVLAIGAAFGIVVPSWIVTLAVLAATTISFMFWFKKLPKILVIIFLVLIVSLIVSFAA